MSRRLVVAALIVVAIVGACRFAAATELSDQQVLKLLTTEHPRDRTIRRGLAFLRSQQKPDGSLGREHATANTSFAIIAHLAAGHNLDDPQYGAWLRKALAFVLAAQDENGYFGLKDGSRMYGHGIATLMLAEALGQTKEDDIEESIRRALERAVAVTVNAALVKKRPGHEGGWRYQPHEDQSDLSLSGWQIMSLHATQQVGITVPEKVIKGAVDYAKRMTGPDGRVGYDHPGEDHPALRGLSMLCFTIGGQDNAPEVARIANRIQSDPISWQGPWFFYRCYYDAVGMSRASPDIWEAYAPRLEAVLIEHQKEDGTWPSPPGDNEGEHGQVYTTSMAVLALAVQRHVLPAYQR